MITSVFFDFDGTLCNSANIKTLAFAELYKEYGKEIQEKVVEYHLKNAGQSRFVKFHFFEETLLNNKLTDEKINKLSDKFSSIVKEKIIMADEICGATKLLDKLNYMNVNCFIVSATPNDEMKEIVEKKKWNKYFKEVLGSPKNKSELINDLMKKYNIKNNNGIMIGDAISDYNAAMDNSLKFIAVKNNENLNSFPMDIKIIDNFSDFSL